MTQMKFVVHITGYPGSGKGTQSELLIKNLGFAHFSVGQLMRDEIAAGSDLGKQLECINDGKIAPPEVTMEVIKKALNQCEATGVVLDGFPRTIGQAEIYNRIVGQPNVTLLFVVPEPECRRRLIARALDSDRTDDKHEIIEKRFVEFYDKTVSAMDFVKQTGVTVEIDGVGTVEEVWERVNAAVQAHQLKFQQK